MMTPVALPLMTPGIAPVATPPVVTPGAAHDPIDNG